MNERYLSFLSIPTLILTLFVLHRFVKSSAVGQPQHYPRDLQRVQQ
jgi:hypothetical protein